MKENLKEIILAQLRKTPVIQVACEKVGISRATFYRWRQDDQPFAKAAAIALREGEDLVNDMAESQLMGAIRDKDMAAIKFWLKYHHPVYTTRIELTTPDQPDKELTDEQKALLKKALELVALHKDNPDDQSTPPLKNNK